MEDLIKEISTQTNKEIQDLRDSITDNKWELREIRKEQFNQSAMLRSLIKHLVPEEPEDNNMEIDYGTPSFLDDEGTPHYGRKLKIKHE